MQNAYKKPVVDPVQFTDYYTRFSSETGEYTKVTEQFPEVRLAEFRNFQTYSALKNPLNLLQIPAEGNVLRYLYPDATIKIADFVKPAPREDHVFWTDWDLNGIEDDFYDGVFSITPIHHSDEQQANRYLRGALRALRPGGVVVFAEPELDSPVANFLNEFVHEHTETGHKGRFPSADFAEELRKVGFEKVSTDILPCDWIFTDSHAAFQYFSRLFNLQSTTPDRLLAELSSIGLRSEADHLILKWELRYFKGEKSPSMA
jgi:SAM-dependent methyltransferase